MTTNIDAASPSAPSSRPARETREAASAAGRPAIGGGTTAATAGVGARRGLSIVEPIPYAES